MFCTTAEQFWTLARGVQLLFHRQAEPREGRSPTLGIRAAVARAEYRMFIEEQFSVVVSAVSLTSEEVRPRRR